MKPTHRLRWWIAWALFLSTTINYISRQTFSVLSPVITREFHLSHSDLSWVLSVFQLSYAGMWLIGGFLLDVVGTRLGLALAVAWWSIISMLTGFANSLAQFALFRFLLGIGEGCNWPGASKAVAEWFPAKERGVAVAIFDSGSSVGGAIAAVMVPWVSLALGWRYAFAVSGVLGFAWLLLWLRIYYPLYRHPRVSDQERALIEAGHDTAKQSARSGLARWLHLLRDRNSWGILLGRSLTDPIWWFYVFWLPQYLSDARGFSLKQIAAFAWIPFVAADIGNFTGGFASAFLIKRGVPVLRARKWVCAISCLPVLAGIPAATAHSAYSALAFIAFAVWGYASWSTMGLTFPSDLFPQDAVASVTGLSGFGAGLVGTLFTLAVGKLVDKFSYFPAFFAAATLPLLATAAVLILLSPRTESAPAQRAMVRT
ncbi:MAG TPA: MFS transporter [Terriglobia bacterium]|nr:MFS transporter [Terriglobia bacterium]